VPLTQIRLPDASPELSAGLARIREEFQVPLDFPAEVADAAEASARRGPAHEAERRDARYVPFVTIDPRGSRDLDQAFFAETLGDGFRVSYAIADVSAFVVDADPIDREAHERGVTLYLPDERAPLHPTVLSEGAASLLPGEVRPALLWTIDLDGEGSTTASRLERATVRSREALTYAAVSRSVRDGSAPPPLELLRTIGELRRAQEQLRGGISIAVPTQEVVRDGDGYRPRYDEPRPAERWNAQISLLTGMTAAQMMIDAGVGILRTLPPAPPDVIDRLRRTATTLGISWADGATYPDVVRALDPGVAAHAAFLTQAVQVLRGAGYEVIAPGEPAPQHSAIAAPYAHVTAPPRRLVDRFANEVLVALSADEDPPTWVVDGLVPLPKAMARAGHRAAAIEHAVIDLAESIVLSTRVGEQFEATVVDLDGDHATALVRDPAVVASIEASGLELGEQITVKLVTSTPETRLVEFEVAR